MARNPVADFYADDGIDLAGLGGALEGLLDAERLFSVDQDHYGGVATVAAVAAAAGIHPGSVVLDLCAGIGGPARYLASRYGCRVVAVDVTPSRCAGGRHLNRIVGLGPAVSVVCGDALWSPLRASTFTTVVSIDGFLHVADKAGLLAECRRVLRDGGVLVFEDWVAAPTLPPRAAASLARAFVAPGIAGVACYLDALGAAGFVELAVTDLSEGWRGEVRATAAAYRDDAEDLAERHGRDVVGRWLARFEVLVPLVDAGYVGHARFRAVAA